MAPKGQVTPDELFNKWVEKKVLAAINDTELDELTLTVKVKNGKVRAVFVVSTKTLILGAKVLVGAAAGAIAWLLLNAPMVRALLRI
jgi:hypothetical protein